MINRKELIEKVTREFFKTHQNVQVTEFSQFLCNELDRIYRIKDSVDDAGDEIIKIQNEASNRTQIVNTRIKLIRDGCRHEDTTYYADPSGNNDSYTQCNICGANL